MDSIREDEYVDLILKNLLFFRFRDITVKEALSKTCNDISYIYMKKRKYLFRFSTYFVILRDEKLSNGFDRLFISCKLITDFYARDRLGILIFADIGSKEAETLAMLTKEKNLFLHKGGGQVLLLVNLFNTKVFIITEGRVVTNIFTAKYRISRNFYNILLIKKLRI